MDSPSENDIVVLLTKKKPRKSAAQFFFAFFFVLEEEFGSEVETAGVATDLSAADNHLGY